MTTRVIGMVLLVIERDDDTVDTRAIKTSYSPAAGTSYVQFIDAVVPVANLIGKPGMGFMYVPNVTLCACVAAAAAAAAAAVAAVAVAISVPVRSIALLC